MLHFEQYAMPGSPLTYKESNTRCSPWQHDNVMVKLDLNIEKQMCSLNVLYDHLKKCCRFGDKFSKIRNLIFLCYISDHLCKHGAT